jgi:hypothetical protein
MAIPFHVFLCFFDISNIIPYIVLNFEMENKQYDINILIIT